MGQPFYFYTRFNLVRLIGLKAVNLLELIQGIKTVPASSIYYHTHKFLEQHHSLSPEPPNDFAYWINNILQFKDMGEALASIDIIQFKDLESLRLEFIKILESYIDDKRYASPCPKNMEFHFIGCTTFNIKTPYVANNITEFLAILEKISINALYYHMFEARLRLHRNENDFSAWFKSIKQKQIAEKISSLDPYTITLDGLRKKIMGIIKRYATD